MSQIIRSQKECGLKKLQTSADGYPDAKLRGTLCDHSLAITNSELIHNPLARVTRRIDRLSDGQMDGDRRLS